MYNYYDLVRGGSGVLCGGESNMFVSSVEDWVESF